MMIKESQYGVLYVLGAAILWSTGGLFIKLIQAEPLVIVVFRAGIAGLCFLPFATIKGLPLNKHLLAYILSFAWLVVAFVSATKLTAAANAIALQNTAPLFLFVLGLFKREVKPGLKNTIPMVFILLGICAFLLEPNEGGTLIGNVIGISSGVAFASMTYFLRYIAAGGAGLVSISNLATALLIAPFADFGGISAISPKGWAALIYLGAIQIGLAYVFYARGLERTQPLRASILALSEAILNPIWVMLFIGEVPTAYGLVGIVFILGAVAVDISLKSREKEENCEKIYYSADR
jgi:drug/metabolite transporter (DMT)-like permease